MSGRLVSAVFDSALPPWLKPYAAAFASFAADDGTRVYPSIARIARMVGRSARSAQTAATELRRLGILLVDVQHARDRATRYVFNTAALPSILDPGQLPLFPQALIPKTGAKSHIADVFHSHPQELTGSGLPVRGEVGFTRSVSDPPVRTTNRKKPRAEKRNAKTGTHDAN